jgi:hypothetical protein
VKLKVTLALVVLAGCAGPKPVSVQVASEQRTADREKVQEQLSPEMSLKADRDQLKDLRKQIPQEKQKSNDELALFLQLMQQGTEQPQMVHDRFTTLVEKRRTVFREKVQRLRDSYRQDESARRDEYLDKQKSVRNSFSSSKRTPDEVKTFFAKQDTQRKTFFADERDRRTSFESELSAQSKDFESYMRERINEFNEQYRLYSKKFSERPVQKKAVTGEANDSSEFKRIEEVPAKAIGTDD